MPTYHEPARDIPIVRDADVLATHAGLPPRRLDVRLLQATLVAQRAELRTS